MSAPADNRGDGGGRRMEPEQGELFEKHLSASYPSPTSLAGRALSQMLQGQRLRQSEWLKHSWRLAAAVKDLGYLGWPVVSKPVRPPGCRRPIAEYFLPDWVLREVGVRHG